MTHIQETVMDTDPTIRNKAICLICGQCDYEWGTLGMSQFANFVANDDGWCARSFSHIMGTQSVARRCKNCGNLQLFTK